MGRGGLRSRLLFRGRGQPFAGRFVRVRRDLRGAVRRLNGRWGIRRYSTENNRGGRADVSRRVGRRRLRLPLRSE
jgi:hypothetical protein